MTTWKIVDWDQNTKAGVVASKHYSDLKFDSTDSDYEDFVIGESVLVELDSQSSLKKIRLVKPIYDKIRRQDDFDSAPKLNKHIVLDIKQKLQKFSLMLDYRIESMNQRNVMILGDDSQFEYGAGQNIQFVDVSYLDIPTFFSPDVVRLSTQLERDYLLSKKYSDLSDIDVAFSIVGDGKIHFIIAGNFESKNLR